MFKARKEQLKDFKKLIRITKKLVLLVQEKKSLEKEFMSGIEGYLKMKDDIKSLEKSRLKSTIAIQKMKEYTDFLKEQLKAFEEENPINTEKKKLKNKIDALSIEIEEYAKYIESKSHDFTYCNLTPTEYTLCECDDLSIFIILLIFKKRIADIENRNIAEQILLDCDSQFYFRRRIFFHENVIRTALTKQFNQDNNTEFQPAIWEKQDDLLDYPLFKVMDFESFIALL